MQTLAFSRPGFTGFALYSGLHPHFPCKHEKCSCSPECTAHCLRKKTLILIKGRGLRSCYHLFSQTAHTACLKRYALSRIPGYYNVYHLRCSLLNFYVIRCKAQGCIHVLLSMRLSSAGCFLYAFAENYLFPSLPSHEIKAIIGSYIIFVNGIFLRCNFHKVIL